MFVLIYAVLSIHKRKTFSYYLHVQLIMKRATYLIRYILEWWPVFQTTSYQEYDVCG